MSHIKKISAALVIFSFLLFPAGAQAGIKRCLKNSAIKLKAYRGAKEAEVVGTWGSRIKFAFFLSPHLSHRVDRLPVQDGLRVDGKNLDK